MKSAWRGEARGIAPKRIRSARGPPVCISSIPQQARPKSRYQSELSRAMLMSLSSWLVWKRVTSPPTPESICCAAIVFTSGRETCGAPSGRPAAVRVGPRLRRLGRRAGQALHPREIAVRPDPHQPDDEDRGEEEELEERDPGERRALPRPGAEHGDDGEGEGDVHLEDHEDEGDEVEPRVEVEPGHPDRSLTALVDGRLLGVRDAGTGEAREGDPAQGEPDGHDREHHDGGKVVTHARTLLCGPILSPKLGKRRRSLPKQVLMSRGGIPLTIPDRAGT